MKLFVVIISCLFGILFCAGSAKAQALKPHPSDLIKDLPALEWAMKSEAAKTAVKKANLQFASPTKDKIVWGWKYLEWDGQANILFNDKNALWEMAFVIWAYKNEGDKVINQSNEVFAKWDEALTAKYGKLSQMEDNEISKSHVWRLTGVVVELRLVKENGAVDVHWVKE